MSMQPRQRHPRRPGIYGDGKRGDETQRQHLGAILGFLGADTGKNETQKLPRRKRTGRRPREQVTACKAEEGDACFFWKSLAASGGDIIQRWQCGSVLKYTTTERGGPRISA